MTLLAPFTNGTRDTPAALQSQQNRLHRESLSGGNATQRAILQTTLEAARTMIENILAIRRGDESKKRTKMILPKDA